MEQLGDNAAMNVAMENARHYAEQLNELERKSDANEKIKDENLKIFGRLEEEVRLIMAEDFDGFSNQELTVDEIANYYMKSLDEKSGQELRLLEIL